MHTIIILAHGSLGEWDELIFLSIAAIFLIMMGIAWVRSRVSTPEALEESPEESSTSASNNEERFPLEK
ncbi:MAG: hypothetical protein GC179_31335 [Anaerolineaceae bacterium]|nr:hypothetical protein [Anaerolineaceae bacterium]